MLGPQTEEEKRNPLNLIMICTNPSCKFTFCFNCKEEWHADTTCEKYQKWKQENSKGDSSYRDWVRLHAKPCPGCGNAIEKNGGCNHMTCQKCDHQFCWLCMGQYSSDHFSSGQCAGKQFT